MECNGLYLSNLLNEWILNVLTTKKYICEVMDMFDHSTMYIKYQNITLHPSIGSYKGQI